MLVATASTLPAQISQAEYAARRAALAATMHDGVLVAFGAAEPAQDYLAFNQSESFNYLTGFREPDAALVIIKQGGAVRPIMFVQPREPSREVWTGIRLGTSGLTRLTGMPARVTDQLRPTLDSLLATGMALSVVGDFKRGGPMSPEQQMVNALRARYPNVKVADLGSAVHKLRGKKTPAEQALIRQAVDITVLAQRDAIRTVKPGLNEFEVQAIIEYTFRRNGADRPSFSTIVGSGPNSTTLHYNTDDRFMNAGEMVVMDIGASYGGYAADVTRTVPVSGVFSPDQRVIYQLVRDAQSAAERQATLGGTSRALSDSARATLGTGLATLGLIESPDATYDCSTGQSTSTQSTSTQSAGAWMQCPQLSMYYMHGLGHGIGLEVHDPDQYSSAPIQPGSAFTIEPGIYVRASVLDDMPDTPRNRAIKARLQAAVDRYRNIGVRIEDDYLVTDKGVEWISRAPREIVEIEALMKEKFAGPGPRNADLVNSYRMLLQVP